MNNKPTIIERARIALDVFRRGLPWERQQAKQRLPLAWPTWRDGTPQWQIVDAQSYIQEGFNLNSLIYSCLMYKHRSISNAKLRAYGGDPEHPELLKPNHPLAKLVYRPNPYMSRASFVGLTDTYLNIFGYAPIVLVRPRSGGMPEQMFPLNPSRVYIIPEKGGIKGYLYIPEGKGAGEGIPILPQDMMFPKLPNPGDPLDGLGYGMSPFAPLAHSADVDNMITKFLKLFFERGTMVSGVLKFSVPLDDPTVAQVKERWMEMYGGYENWDEIGVLDQGGEYQRMGMTFDEMGFETLDERNETRILGPFGVPPILIGSRVGLARSTYSNYEEARRAFWEDTMTFEISLLEDEFGYFLQSDDGGFVQFDLSQVPALRKDVPGMVNAWRGLVEYGVPKSQAAEVVGLQLGDLMDGDVSYMPLSLIPINSSAPAPATNNQGAAEAVDDSRSDSGKALPFPRKRFACKAFTPEMKLAHAKAVDRIARSWEPKFGDAASQCFEHDKREILALLNEAKSKALQEKATIDWQAYLLRIKDYLEMGGTENWRSVFAPVVQGVITDQGKRWANTLGVEFDVQNLFSRDWFNKYTLVFAQPINQTTLETIAKMATQAQAEGWSISEMSDHLETMFTQWMDGSAIPEDFQWFSDRMPPYRREAIARTETIRASSAGDNELFQEWGVQKKEWVSTRDDRVRTHENSEFDHLAANGEVVPMDEPFVKTGEPMMYPGDPNGSVGNFVNCRCTLVPVIEDANVE